MSRGTELSFAPRYYPDAAYPELAIPITVGADLRRGGLDLRVGEGAASHRVVFRADAASLLASLPEPLSAYVDDEVARFEVWVRPLGLGTIGLSPFRAPVTALGDGEWALPPLPAGEYEIQIGYSDALMDRVGEIVLSLDWAVRNPIVRVRVAVEDAEVDLGAMVGAPRIRVSGRLVIRSEAEDALAPQDLGQRLSVVDADFAAATSARVVEPDEDGVFALDLYPGRFVLSASLDSYSETWYVASAFSGSTDLLRDHLVAGGSVAPVEIVLADGAGRLDGVVRSEDRDLVPDARVVLVPLPGERGAITQFPSAVADLTGAFSLERIPPGEYRVLAIDESGRIGSEAYWQDPVFLRQYELRGERITVDPGARMTIDPEAILLEY
jgi:hypothetical protein